MLQADIHILYQSDFYKIVNYTCHCNFCSISEAEYNDSFNISFIKRGFFEYRTFRRNEEAHTGRILISKPGFEHTTRHVDHQPDVTITIEFKKEFFNELEKRYGPATKWWIMNNDIHSLLIYSNAELEYLLYNMLQLLATGAASALEIDEQVIMILERIIDFLSNFAQPIVAAENLKQYHLPTVEAAQDYMLNHFRKNISLQQLAQFCHVSPFHFSRIFKNLLNISPHQYLSSVRLSHARTLLKTTGLPVKDIAFECGFNSPEHFVTSYKMNFLERPRDIRRQSA